MFLPLVTLVLGVASSARADKAKFEKRALPPADKWFCHPGNESNAPGCFPTQESCDDDSNQTSKPEKCVARAQAAGFTYFSIMRDSFEFQGLETLTACEEMRRATQQQVADFKLVSACQVVPKVKRAKAAAVFKAATTWSCADAEYVDGLVISGRCVPGDCDALAAHFDRNDLKQKGECSAKSDVWGFTRFDGKAAMVAVEYASQESCAFNLAISRSGSESQCERRTAKPAPAK